MAAEAEAGAGLSSEGEGEVVEGTHLRVQSEGLPVAAETGVGAEEGVGEGDRRWVRHLREQLVSIGGAAACTIQHEEGMKAAVVEMAGRKQERVDLGGGGGSERGRVLGVEEGEALPDRHCRAVFH